MGVTTAFFAFDPKKESLDIRESTHISSAMAFEKFAVAFRNKTIEERKAAGESDPFTVPICHREIKNEVRFLNFNPKYQGSISHASALLEGKWRFATAEEVAFEMKAQAAARANGAGAQLDRLAKQARQTV